MRAQNTLANDAAKRWHVYARPAPHTVTKPQHAKKSKRSAWGLGLGLYLQFSCTVWSRAKQKCACEACNAKQVEPQPHSKEQVMDRTSKKEIKTSAWDLGFSVLVHVYYFTLLTKCSNMY